MDFLILFDNDKVFLAGPALFHFVRVNLEAVCRVNPLNFQPYLRRIFFQRCFNARIKYRFNWKCTAIHAYEMCHSRHPVNHGGNGNHGLSSHWTPPGEVEYQRAIS